VGCVAGPGDDLASSARLLMRQAQERLAYAPAKDHARLVWQENKLAELSPSLTDFHLSSSRNHCPPPSLCHHLASHLSLDRVTTILHSGRRGTNGNLETNASRLELRHGSSFLSLVSLPIGLFLFPLLSRASLGECVGSEEKKERDSRTRQAGKPACVSQPVLALPQPPRRQGGGVSRGDQQRS